MKTTRSIKSILVTLVVIALFAGMVIAGFGILIGQPIWDFTPTTYKDDTVTISYIDYDPEGADGITYSNWHGDIRYVNVDYALGIKTESNVGHSVKNVIIVVAFTLDGITTDHLEAHYWDDDLGSWVKVLFYDDPESEGDRIMGIASPVEGTTIAPHGNMMTNIKVKYNTPGDYYTEFWPEALP